MIISASCRTDIPAFYSDWLINRLKEQYVLVRNPMKIHQVSRISLSPDVVDGIVFWTKNPKPMIPYLTDLEKYIYYFQVTLTAYDHAVEPNIPSKDNVILPAFKMLSKTIGRNRVLWRYDPIFFTERYTFEYHCKNFRILAEKLGEYTEKCTISFLDLYKNTKRNIYPLGIQVETREMQCEIIQYFSEIAQKYGFFIGTCAEQTVSENFYMPHACCIDKERFEHLGNYTLKLGKDPNQRRECGCIASIDIGTYNTCKHGCLYCYANYSQNTVRRNAMMHNPKAPLLFGELTENDVIKDRAVQSCIEKQLSIFDI